MVNQIHKLLIKAEVPKFKGNTSLLPLMKQLPFYLIKILYSNHIGSILKLLPVFNTKRYGGFQILTMMPLEIPSKNFDF